MRQMLTFLKKEALHILHTPEALLLMLLLPICITWVLGTAFSGVVSPVIKLPETDIPVVTDGGFLGRTYVNMADNAHLHLTLIDEEALQKGVTDGSIRQYIRATQQGVTHFTDDPSGIDAMLVRTYSRIFLNQSAFALTQLQKGRLPLQSAPSDDHVRLEGIAGKNGPTSFGYYGVTMITMIVMYGAMQAVDQMTNEGKERTYLRLKASPFSMRKVFFYKALAASLVLLLQVVVLLLFSSLVYHVPYRSIPTVIVILIPMMLFATSLGVLAAQVFKQQAAATGFLNLIVVVTVFLGGGYVMIDESTGPLYKMLSFSPVGWVNKGIFRFVYSNDMSIAWQAMGGCALLAALMLAVAYRLFVKEEGSDRVAGC